MSISNYDAEYIKYNIKCFFEHYELEKRIVKLTADCIILKKMTKEVDKMIPRDDQDTSNTSIYKHNKAISTRPNCNPKIATNTTSLERKKSHKKDLISKRDPKNIEKRKKTERALTNEKRENNRLITKSPTVKTHRFNQSFHHTSALSKDKSVRNLSTTKSIDFSLSNERVNPLTKANKRNNQAQTPINKLSNLLKEHKSKDFNTVKKTKINDESYSTEPNKKGVVKAHTPTISRGPTPTKKTKVTNHITPKLGKKSEKKIDSMTPTTPTATHSKLKQGKRPTTPKIGEFKDQTTNRSISPIEQLSSKENNKRTAQQQKSNQIKTNKPKIIAGRSKKKKDITLNTSKESIKSDSENEITEEILQAQRNKYINTYITPRVMFSSSRLKTIYLLLKSGYLPIAQKIKIAIAHSELYAQFPGKILYKELLSNYEKEYINKEQLLSRYDSTLINKTFIASKTAQNGLNFITKDEEAYLLKKAQPKEINQIFTVVLILINENIAIIPEEERISYLIDTVYPKYQVDNISKPNNIYYYPL